MAFLGLSHCAVGTNSPQGHMSWHQCKGTKVGDSRFSFCGGLVKTTKSLSAFLSWFISFLLVDG